MTEWTESDYKEDVCHNGEIYIKIDEFSLPHLQRGVWFRDGDYSEQHSVHGVFRGAEDANAAGQVLLSYRLPTINSSDMHCINISGNTMFELTLPAKFGAAGLLVHNGIPVHGSRDEAVKAVQQNNFPIPGINP
jgi:hypothetical protein